MFKFNSSDIYSVTSNSFFHYLPYINVIIVNFYTRYKSCKKRLYLRLRFFWFIYREKQTHMNSQYAIIYVANFNKNLEHSLKNHKLSFILNNKIDYV